MRVVTRMLTMLTYGLIISGGRSVMAFVNNIQSMEALREVKTGNPRILFFTGKGCRACRKCDRIVKDIHSAKIHKIILNNIDYSPELRQSLLHFAKENGVKTIPVFIIKDGEKKRMIPCFSVFPNLPDRSFPAIVGDC